MKYRHLANVQVREASPSRKMLAFLVPVFCIGCIATLALWEWAIKAPKRGATDLGISSQ
jgi:hypothetical protein